MLSFLHERIASTRLVRAFATEGAEVETFRQRIEADYENFNRVTWRNTLLAVGADFLSGDRGDDTLVGGAGADLFHTFNDAGLDRVLDFNAAEGDRVMLAPGTTYSVGQVGDDTVIDLGGGTRMVLVGVTLASLGNGWIFGA